jgi:Mn-dependent DtxR family transcriptional regulator
MKTTTNEMKLMKRAELYRTISMRRIAMMFKVEKPEAQKIVDRAVRKGLISYIPVNGRIQLRPTCMTRALI